jgi:predicted permease
VAIASGLLFGIAPALRAPTRRLEQTLRAGARTLAGGSRRLHSAFVISQIALAVVLLVSAGMLGRTLLRLSALDPGLNLHNVLTARVALSPASLANPDRTRAAWQDLLERARLTPGLQSIAMVDTVPMRSGSNPIGFRTSAAAVPEKDQPLVLANSVSPDYLKVTGIPLRRGRFLTDQDRMGAPGVAVIDEVMAQQAFGGEYPIGKRIWIDSMGSDPVTVVGVVGHVRYWGLAADDQAPVRAQLYYPFAQVPDSLVRRWSELMSVAVRTDIEPMSLLPELRRNLRGDTGDQVIYQVRTLEQLVSEGLAQQRFLLALFSVFAGLALLLACVGVYGVLSYLTSERIPEMGVRLALGAKAGTVVWLVLRQSLGMIAIGAMFGAAAAIAADRLLQRLVEGMQPGGFAASAGMIGILAAAALLASYLPARRAGRIDPMKALRQN